MSLPLYGTARRFSAALRLPSGAAAKQFKNFFVDQRTIQK
jgi:hypothetical protein